MNDIRKEFIQHSTSSKQFQSIQILHNIHREVINLLKIKLFKFIKKKIKINILQHKIISKLDVHDNTEFILNTISLLDINCLLFIFIPLNFINQLIELFFGTITNVVYYKNNDIFNSSKRYIVHKFMHIFIESYNNIFNKWYIFNEQYYIYTNKIDFKTLQTIQYKSYFQTEFSYQYQNLKHSIFIKIPDLAFFTIQNKYKKIIQTSIVNNNNFSINQHLLRHICLIKLNCIVQLEKCLVSSNNIVNLKVGDILYIENPNNLIVRTDNNIFILLGKYYTDGKKSIFYVKKNLISTNFNNKD